MKHISQNKRILNILDSGGSLTNAEAASLRIYRLSGRIHELRKAGFNIISTDETSIDENGFKSRYSRYTMGGD